MNRLALAIFLIVFNAAPALADAPVNPAAEERLAALKTELALSDEQFDAFAPIMRASMAERQAILAKYGIDLEDRSAPPKRPGFRKAMAMRSELDGARQDLMASLEGVLSDDQLTAFNRIQEAQRAAMRERMMGR